jgi:hypothetical protein
MKPKAIKNLHELQKTVAALLASVDELLAVKTQLGREIIERIERGEGIDQLHKERETLMQGKIVKTERLLRIEEGIRDTQEIYNIAHIQIGRLSKREDELEKTTASLLLKCVKSRTLQKIVAASRLELLADV